jgi:D-alanyl-D-alanine carboxypeptidase (penicillin-binding protein 5/6)
MLRNRVQCVVAWWLVLCLILLSPVNGLTVKAEEEDTDLGITAKAAVLMEASTGECIYEKDADEQLSPASITKIMTLILIFDAIEQGKITLEDEVTTSAYAKSMGGSQVFLEEGEKQTVETLIKCIVIASGNDAAVTMAEYLAGSEEEFVKMMNERAEGLGMTGTHFEDCCGLTDSPTHLTTARDVAIMSRELITHYPQISDYSTIWMETITHVTKQGTKEFCLSNTNKLLKMNSSFNVTGLKTGSTSQAKYCFAATAEKDGISLIAVIMAAPDYKVRFSQAQTLLNYGYANCTLYQDNEPPNLSQIAVSGGVEEQVTLQYESNFQYLSTKGESFQDIEKELELPEQIVAPCNEGDTVGRLVYRMNGEEIGSVNITLAESVEKAGFFDYLSRVFGVWMGNS